MGVLAFIAFVLSGLCAVVGIISAALATPLPAGFDVTFWFSLAVILLLATIASFLAQSRYE